MAFLVARVGTGTAWHPDNGSRAPKQPTSYARTLAAKQARAAVSLTDALHGEAIANRYVTNSSCASSIVRTTVQLATAAPRLRGTMRLLTLPPRPR